MKTQITRFNRKGNVIEEAVSTKLLYVVVLEGEKPFKLSPAIYREAMKEALDKKICDEGDKLKFVHSFVVTVW